MYFALTASPHKIDGWCSTKYSALSTGYSIHTLCIYIERMTCNIQKTRLINSLYDIILLQGRMELLVLMRTQLDGVEHKTDILFLKLLHKIFKKWQTCTVLETYQIMVTVYTENSRNSSYFCTANKGVGENKGLVVMFGCPNW